MRRKESTLFRPSQLYIKVYSFILSFEDKVSHPIAFAHLIDNGRVHVWTMAEGRMASTEVVSDGIFLVFDCIERASKRMVLSLRLYQRSLNLLSFVI